MNTKYTALAAAVAGVLGAAQSASALQLQGTTFDVTVYQSGSSAMMLPIQQIWKDFCSGNGSDLTIYEDAGTGKNYRAYACTLDPVQAGIPSALRGKTMLYVQRLNGGSIFGVNPVANSTPVGFLDLSAANCPQTTATGVAACGSATVSQVPDAGISDVEPKLFTGPNIPAAADSGGIQFAALSQSQLNLLHIDPLLQQTFAVGVGSALTGVTALSTNQLASIFAGTISDWHAINNAIAPKTKIQVCYRTAGSGTQAAANALFLNSPCSSVGALALGTLPTFHANASTGAMLTCLNGNGGLGIGIFSLADGPTAGTDTFKTVQIAGVAPSAQAAAMGTYPYAVESTLQYRNSSSTSTPTGQLVVALAGILSTPSSLATLNGTLPGGPALNAQQKNGTPHSPYQAGTPVEWGSRGGSTCSPMQLNFPNGVQGT